MTLNSKQLGYKRNEKAYAWQSKFKTTDEKRIEELEQQLQAEQQAHNALMEKLKSLEFLPDYVIGNDYDLCEVCKSYRKDGHAANCWISQAIKDDSK